jgi:hypothetical protein
MTTTTANPTQTATALKEWASVVTAILEGKQNILIRKGGIIEKHDCFEVESEQFLFYPTFLHQDVTRIDEVNHDYLDKAQQFKLNDSQIMVSGFAQVVEIFKVSHFEQLQAVLPLTIYNQHHIELLWNWKPEKPCYVLLLKAATLETPVAITEKPEYGGCVSWIELDEVKQQLCSNQPLNLMPALSDTAFAKIQTVLKEKLA